MISFHVHLLQVLITDKIETEDRKKMNDIFWKENSFCVNIIYS